MEWPGQLSSPGRPRRCRTGFAPSGRALGGEEEQQQPPQQEYAPAPEQYSAPPPPPQDTGVDLDKLKQLGELRDSGVLTEAEFQAQKARILAG